MRAMLRRVLLALWCALAATSGAVLAREPEASIETVLAPFEKIQALRAEFREEKQIALLAKPLVSEGELYYARPHTLARHTQSPVESRLVVRDDRLTMRDSAGVQHLDLSAQPEVASFVEALMLLFEGNAERLKKLMHHELRVDDSGFELTLEPRSDELRKLLREMQVKGQGAVLSSLRIVDGFGDVSVTTFRDVKLRKPFSEAERERLFSVKP